MELGRGVLLVIDHKTYSLLMLSAERRLRRRLTYVMMPDGNCGVLYGDRCRHSGRSNHQMCFIRFSYLLYVQ